MGKKSDQQFAWAAENFNSAFCAMYADTHIADLRAAIISLMAVIFIISVCIHLASDIIIPMIFGVIILIVRGNLKPVSRTR